MDTNLQSRKATKFSRLYLDFSKWSADRTQMRKEFGPQEQYIFRYLDIDTNIAVCVFLYP